MIGLPRPVPVDTSIPQVYDGLADAATILLDGLLEAGWHPSMIEPLSVELGYQAIAWKAGAEQRDASFGKLAEEYGTGGLNTGSKDGWWYQSFIVRDEIHPRAIVIYNPGGSYPYRIRTCKEGARPKPERAELYQIDTLCRTVEEVAGELARMREEA